MWNGNGDHGFKMESLLKWHNVLHEREREREREKREREREREFSKFQFAIKCCFINMM